MGLIALTKNNILMRSRPSWDQDQKNVRLNITLTLMYIVEAKHHIGVLSYSMTLVQKFGKNSTVGVPLSYMTCTALLCHFPMHQLRGLSDTLSRPIMTRWSFFRTCLYFSDTNTQRNNSTFPFLRHLTISRILLGNRVKNSTATSLSYLFTTTVISMGLTAFYSSSCSVRSSLQPYLSTVLATSSTSQSHWRSSFIKTSLYSFHIFHLSFTTLASATTVLFISSYLLHILSICLSFCLSNLYISVSPSLLSSFAASHCTSTV